MGGDMRYEIGQNAYIKLVLQALNHNTSAVDGLLLALIQTRQRVDRLGVGNPSRRSTSGVFVIPILLSSHFPNRCIQSHAVTRHNFQARQRVDRLGVGNPNRRLPSQSTSRLSITLPRQPTLRISRLDSESIDSESAIKAVDYPHNQLRRCRCGGRRIPWSEEFESVLEFLFGEFESTEKRQRRLSAGNGETAEEEAVKGCLTPTSSSTSSSATPNASKPKNSNIGGLL